MFVGQHDVNDLRAKHQKRVSLIPCDSKPELFSVRAYFSVSAYSPPPKYTISWLLQWGRIDAVAAYELIPLKWIKPEFLPKRVLPAGMVYRQKDTEITFNFPREYFKSILTPRHQLTPDPRTCALRMTKTLQDDTTIGSHKIDGTNNMFQELVWAATCVVTTTWQRPCDLNLAPPGVTSGVTA